MCIRDRSGTGTIGNDIKFPAGHVIQVVSKNHPNHWEQTCNTQYRNWEYARDSAGDLNVQITPKYNTSKILVTFHFGQVRAHNTSLGYGLGLIAERSYGADMTNATRIGTNASANLPSCSFSGHIDQTQYDAHAISWGILDTPATTELCTYKIVLVCHSTSNYIVGFNRTNSVGSGDDQFRVRRSRFARRPEGIVPCTRPVRRRFGACRTRGKSTVVLVTQPLGRSEVQMSARFGYRHWRGD